MKRSSIIFYNYLCRTRITESATLVLGNRQQLLAERYSECWKNKELEVEKSLVALSDHRKISDFSITNNEKGLQASAQRVQKCHDGVEAGVPWFMDEWHLGDAKDTGGITSERDVVEGY